MVITSMHVISVIVTLMLVSLIHFILSLYDL